MDKNNLSSEVDISKIGNYTKNAVEDFEENIISQHNFLEKIHTNSNKK